MFPDNPPVGTTHTIFHCVYTYYPDRLWYAQGITPETYNIVEHISENSQYAGYHSVNRIILRADYKKFDQWLLVTDQIEAAKKQADQRILQIGNSTEFIPGNSLALKQSLLDYKIELDNLYNDSNPFNISIPSMPM
jgi:hypothetical protein